MEPQTNAAEIAIAVLSGGIFVLLGGIGYFMRSWFARFEQAAESDRNQRAKEVEQHRTEHRDLWEAMRPIAAQANRAETKIDTHVTDKQTLGHRAMGD